MKNCNYICRIVNSNRTINMPKFEKLLEATYLLALEVFPFCHVVPSLHRVWGHVAKKMRKMKNKGLVRLIFFTDLFLLFENISTFKHSIFLIPVSTQRKCFGSYSQSSPVPVEIPCTSISV